MGSGTEREGHPQAGGGGGTEGTRTVGIQVMESGGAEMKVGGEKGGLGTEEEEGEGRVVRKGAEVGVGRGHGAEVQWRREKGRRGGGRR